MDRESSNRGDLQAVLGLLRRRLALIIFAVAATVAVALGVSQLQNKEYESTSGLLFKSLYLDAQVSGLPLQIPGEPDRDAETNVRLVSLGAVRARAAARLGQGYTAENLKDRIKVESNGESSLVSVTATAGTPEASARIANALADEFVASRRETVRGQIQTAVNRVESQLQRSGNQSPGVRRSIRLNLEKLRLLSSLQTGDAQVVDRAEPPSSPSAPKPARNAAFGAFIGLLLGLALALAAEQLDRRMRRPEQLEETFGLPLLSAIPYSKKIKKGKAWSEGLAGVDAEAFRRLRANLRYYGRDKDIRSLLLTSAGSESGKTTIALQLAAAAAAGGARVLLIEADLRRPQLASRLDLPNDQGLSTALHPQEAKTNGNRSRRSSPNVLKGLVHTVAAPTRVAENQGENGHGVADPDGFHGAFDVVLAGPPPANASELLDSSEMRGVLQRSRQEYDLTIVDGPPPGLVSDAVPLMKMVDGVIVVGRVGRESRDGLEALRNELERLEVAPVGVVANFARKPPKHPYYSEH